MGRLVSATPHGPVGFASAGRADDYATRVAKFIPAEVIAGYVAIQDIVQDPKHDCSVPNIGWYLLFGFFVLITPAYLYTQRTPGEPFLMHLGIGTLAFIVWSYAMTNCDKFGVFPANFYDPTVAAVLLVVFSLAAGLIQPKK